MGKCIQKNWELKTNVEMNSWLETGLMTDLLGDVIRQSENKKF